METIPDSQLLVLKKSLVSSSMDKIYNFSAYGLFLDCLV